MHFLSVCVPGLGLGQTLLHDVEQECFNLPFTPCCPKLWDKRQPWRNSSPQRTHQSRPRRRNEEASKCASARLQTKMHVQRNVMQMLVTITLRFAEFSFLFFWANGAERVHTKIDSIRRWRLAQECGNALHDDRQSHLYLDMAVREKKTAPLRAS